MPYISNARHEKTDVKVFVVVTPILLWAWHRLLENTIYEVKRLKFWKVGVISKGGWAFFWYDIDKDLKVCFLGPHLMYWVGISLSESVYLWSGRKNENPWWTFMDYYLLSYDHYMMVICNIPCGAMQDPSSLNCILHILMNHETSRYILIVIETVFRDFSGFTMICTSWYIAMSFSTRFVSITFSIYHDVSWWINIYQVQPMEKRVIFSWCIMIHCNIYWYAPTHLREVISEAGSSLIITIWGQYWCNLTLGYLECRRRHLVFSIYFHSRFHKTGCFCCESSSMTKLQSAIILIIKTKLHAGPSPSSTSWNLVHTWGWKI